MFRSITPAHRGGLGPPLLCLHGFTDTWRTWELVLPALERRHDVLAPTLPGHAGGPALPPGQVTVAGIADVVERAMDDAGFATAHVVGNSLGGHLALQLAARGRAESVVALAPAGGWAAGDPAQAPTLGYIADRHAMLRAAAPHADAIVSTAAGRRNATSYTTTSFEHIPAGLLAHQMLSAARCAVAPMIDGALRDGWSLDAGRVRCPVRVVWGTGPAHRTAPSAGRPGIS